MDVQRRNNENAPLKERFLTLYQMLVAQRDFFRKGEVAFPPLGRPNLSELRKLIRSGASALPPTYDTIYTRPLLLDLPGLTKELVRLPVDPPNAYKYFVLTALTNAGIQPGPMSKVARDVKRLQAVVSDIYTSFLYSESRLKLAGPPKRLNRPPLSAFIAKHRVFPEAPKPYMLGVDEVATLTKGLPSK